MATPVLVIFVDALPFDRAINMVNALGSRTYSKSVPGAGYSINVKAEMFAGLKPDDVGYFCEWNYDTEYRSNSFMKGLMPVLEYFGSKSKFLNRVFHKLITLARDENVYSIPYHILPYLKSSGLTAYEYNFEHPTFLSEGDFDRVLYSEEGVNDRKVFDVALSRLKTEKNNRLFVATAELDGIMHSHGMNCDKYESQITLIEDRAVKLIKEFMEIHGEAAKYFLFSDHGMAPVLEGVDFDLEKLFGDPSSDSYIYFVDATFYRVWIIDQSLRAGIQQAFEELNSGHILTEDERVTLGLVDRKHGDIIFMLDESKQFAPNFFGPDLCKAMHGYDPQLNSQLGAYISNIVGTHGSKIDAIEIHKEIQSVL